MVFDIIVIVVLLISALHAFWRGFIREILTIFGAIGGVFAALAFSPMLRPLMDSWLGIKEGAEPTKLFQIIPMELVSGALSYGAIFIIVFGVLSFISHLIAEQVRALGLGAVDRTLGVVFGLARGLLILGIFYLPIHIIMDDDTKKEWFKSTRTHVYIEAIATAIENNLPDDLLPLKETEKKETDPGTDIPSGLEGMQKPETNPASTDTSGYDTKQREMLNTLITKGIAAGVETINPPSR